MPMRANLGRRWRLPTGSGDEGALRQLVDEALRADPPDEVGAAGRRADRVPSPRAVRADATSRDAECSENFRRGAVRQPLTSANVVAPPIARPPSVWDGRHEGVAKPDTPLLTMRCMGDSRIGYRADDGKRAGALDSSAPRSIRPPSRLVDRDDPAVHLGDGSVE